jgi:three-Cys-motif partner protein
MKDDYRLASDGLIARVSGAWARGKLSYLDDFVPPALKATETKMQRYYVDLFAGPGLNIEKETGEEFHGSPLRALQLTAVREQQLRFTHAYLVNKSRKCNEALRARVHRAMDEGGITMPKKHAQFLAADANQVVGRILREIHTDAYVFLVADIERPSHWPWSSVRALHSQGHRSIDLYLLFPLHMAINRMIAYKTEATEASASALTTFFGTEQWRDVAAERFTGSQSPRLRERILELYVGRLRDEGWAHVKVVREIRRSGQQELYRMIFATNHPAGDRIADWSAAQPDKRSGQINFLDKL